MSDPFRPTKVTASILVIVLASGFALSQVSQRFHIGSEMAAALEAAADDHEFRVRVRFPFTPEGFHFTYVQQYGIVSGADDRSVIIRRVTPAEVREIASQYWVESVELAP